MEAVADAGEAVSTDVDAGYDDFLVAGRDEGLGLGQDFRERLA
jgi:hypothetical protein